MSGPAAIPPEAVRAAAEAIERKLLTDPPGEFMTWMDADEELARAALEAAAPRIWAAAWREGYGQGRDDEAQDLPLRDGPGERTP